MKRIIFALVVFSAQALSQTGVYVPGSHGADSLISAFMDRWQIEGGSVAISRHGKLIYNSGFGYTSLDHKEAATPNTRFRIASVSKPITAIAVMKLAEQGKLNIKDTVFGEGHWLSNPYYLEAIRDPRVYHITIEQLLEHTAGWDRLAPSGIFAHSDWPFYPLQVTAAEEMPNPVADSTLIRFQLKQAMNYEPGTRYAYSNVGYLILGKIIEKASGMAYDAFVTQTLFNPLSACDIQLGKNLKKEKLPREAQYISNHKAESVYGEGTTVSTPYGGFNLEAMNAHGGWVSSASDLVRILLSVDQYETAPDLLSSEYTSLMVQPGSVNPFYAKGWSVNKKNNWWHTGSLEGTASFVCRTSSGYTWAFLFNGRSDNSAAFWKELDRLPWNCIAELPAYENIDLFAPTQNVSAFRYVQTKPGTFNISWQKGNGKARLIVASAGQEIKDFPVDGNGYTASGRYALGSGLGENTYVVYNGFGDEFSLSGLEPGKTYTVSGFEYNLGADTSYQEVYKLGCAQQISITPEILAPAMP